MVASNGNDKLFSGYYTDAKVAELAAAFKRVENTENWKFAIDKTLALTNLEDATVIAEAVVFYTGSVAKFTLVKEPGVFNVTAAGYYAAIGS